MFLGAFMALNIAPGPDMARELAELSGNVTRAYEAIERMRKAGPFDRVFAAQEYLRKSDTVPAPPPEVE